MHELIPASPGPAPLIFTDMPGTPWLKLLLSRRTWAGEVPALAAELHDVRLEVPAEYRALCGFGPQGVPLTWPQVWAAPLHAQLLAHPGFPVPAMGIVHVWQRCAVLGEVAEGTTVSLRAQVAGHRPAKRGVEIDLVTTMTAAGQAVWEGRTRFLSRAAPGDGVARTVEEPLPEDAEVRETWELAADLGRRYAAVAQDRNPIHQYAWSAKLFGFERAIVHGMWTVARAAAAMPGDPTELEASFRRPVFLPGQVALVGDARGAFTVTAAGAEKPNVVGSVG